MHKTDQRDYPELWREDDDRNRALYRDLLKAHGSSVKALNWGQPENQRLRFQVLLESGIKNTSTVLDVGCGTADLLAYLRERGFGGRYIGLDLTAEMIAAAKTRFPDKRFEVGDVLSLTPNAANELKSDFVLASGIFYYRQKEPAEFMRRTVERLYALAKVGVAFNSLSSWADRPPESGEFRADPTAIFAMCKDFCPWVTLRHDYHPGDFTVYLRLHPVHPRQPPEL